jgi:hypothetical protein
MTLDAVEVAPAEFKPILRGSPPKPNPFTPLLERTWNENRPWSIVVTARKAIEEERRIRKAAMRMNRGVTIQIQLMPSGEVCAISKLKDLPPEQQVRVVFQARELSKAARHEDDDTDE